MSKQIKGLFCAAQPHPKLICIIFRVAHSLTDSNKKSFICIHISLSNRDSFLYAHLGWDQGGDGDLMFSCLSSQYVPFTPVELIAETSGVPFSSASQSSSSAFCLLVAFHATAISAHPGVMGNCLTGSRDWDHFELLIFILHKGGQAGTGLPLVNTA